MPDLAETLRTIRRDLRAEYLAPHDWPWIIGFSSGKDSTLILHMVVECLQTISPDQRQRPVFLVCNDTLVESPVFHAFVGKMLEQIEDGVTGLNVPLQVIRTAPLPKESFWVNLLGRGYPGFRDESVTGLAAGQFLHNPHRRCPAASRLHADTAPQPPPLISSAVPEV